MSIGLNGTRDYVTNRNNLGTKVEVNVKQDLSRASIIDRAFEPCIENAGVLAPSALSRSMFRHENENSFNIQIWKKVGMDFKVNTYSYRDNTKKKIAAGFQYYVNLTYGMQWKL